MDGNSLQGGCVRVSVWSSSERLSSLWRSPACWQSSRGAGSWRWPGRRASERACLAFQDDAFCVAAGTSQLTPHLLHQIPLQLLDLLHCVAPTTLSTALYSCLYTHYPPRVVRVIVQLGGPRGRWHAASCPRRAVELRGLLSAPPLR
jgi:hypothetical protein